MKTGKRVFIAATTAFAVLLAAVLILGLLAL